MRKFSSHILFPIFAAGIFFLCSKDLCSAEPEPYTQWASLSGTWTFTPKDKPPTTIPVPGFYVWQDLQGVFSQSEQNGWRMSLGQPETTYERTFSVPSAMRGKKIFLRFEAVNFLSDIYLNGHLIHTRKGGFLPFEIDITQSVRLSSSNFLRVDILYYDDRFIGDEGKAFYPVGYYGNLVNLGITGNVYLVARPSVYVEDVCIKTSVRQHEATVRVLVKNTDSIVRQVEIRASAAKNGVTVKEMGIQSVSVQPGKNLQVEFVRTWNDAILWSPGNPHLYDLDCEILENSGIVHSKKERFGFREFWIEGKTFVLNGVRQNLRGDNFVHFGEKMLVPYMMPNRQIFSSVLDSMLALNFNALRISGYESLSWIFDLCDEKGMMVIAPAPIGGLSVPYRSSVYLANANQFVKDWGVRDRNHPSIVMWIPENEIYLYTYDLGKEALATLGQSLASVDDTRPIVYEGDLDLGGLGQVYSVHYMNKVEYPGGWPKGSLYSAYGSCRTSKKPTSWGEYEWYKTGWNKYDRNTWVRIQGIKTRVGRILDVADVRPFRLDWAWHPNPEFFSIYDSWKPTPAQVEFLTASMNPVAVFDRAYFEYAAFPALPTYDEGAPVVRTLVLFNDEETDSEVTLRWSVRVDNVERESGSRTFEIAPGGNLTTDMSFTSPFVPRDKSFILRLSTWKDGSRRFTEDLSFWSRDRGLNPPQQVSGFDIQRSGNAIRLFWSPFILTEEGTQAAGNTFTVQRSDNILFTTGATTTFPATADSFLLDHSPGLWGNPGGVFYRVHAKDAGGRTSEWSEPLAKFEFPLSHPSTGQNAVALPVFRSDRISASAFLNDLPDCASAGYWDAESQSYGQYSPLIPPTDFSMEAGHPYFLYTSQAGSLVLLGPVREADYRLHHNTDRSSFNFIMLPVSRPHLANASDLLADIPGCDGVARWNASIQAYEQYIPQNAATNFSLTPGYAYLVNVTRETSWPGSGGAKPGGLSSATSSEFQSSAPHMVWGRLAGFRGRIAGFTAFMAERPGDILTHRSPGCIRDPSFFAVQCASFRSPWKAGDLLNIEVLDSLGLPLGNTEVRLTWNPCDEAQPVGSSQSLPLENALRPNYPNPFNSTTRIPFAVKEKCRVSLKIYNTRGQEVSTLIEDNLEPGGYEVSWDGTCEGGKQMPSGAYIARMRAGSVVQSRKIILLQ
ncbi:T9SS type A sorting domain-containing protein [bacterium]|nr:T9SS type A sorting domain-containing protein [bacterium]